MLKNLFSTVIGGWKQLVAGLVVGSLLACGVTYKIMHNANLAGETRQAQAEVRLVVHDGEIQQQLAVIYVPRFIAINSNTDRIQQEIPEHVTPQIDHDFPVPLGFVRVWNDATHGPIPGPAAGSDADPSGVPLSDVAHAHAADEGTLDACRAMNDEWWSWYDQHKTVWNKATGQ